MYKLRKENCEEGQIIFKHGDVLDRVYILAEGSIEVFLSIQDEDLVLDNIKVPGSTLGQYSFLAETPITYSARATSETNLLVLPFDKLM